MKSLEYVTEVVDEINKVLQKIDDGEAEALTELILSSDKVFACGTGRSGLAAKAFAMRIGHLGKISAVVGDVTAPNFCPNDVLVVCSGSGETKGQLVMVEKAKKIGGKIALVTTNKDSSIGRLSDVVLHITAPTPKVPVEGIFSVQPLASLFEQSLLITLDIVIMKLMDRMNIDTDYMFSLHANLE